MYWPMFFAGCAVVTAVYFALRSVFIEPKALHVTRHTVDLPAYQGLSRLTILHLTDLHLWEFGKRERLLVDKVRRVKPDVMVLTGDYAESEKGLRALDRLLVSLTETAPCYAVYGDNDHEDPAYERELGRLFAKHGAVLLRNSAALHTAGRQAVLVVGLDDPNSGRSDVDCARRDAVRRLEAGGYPPLRDFPAIVLAHSPEIVPDAESWMDLILSGHTHGGQICLPGGRAMYTNTPRCRGYSAGMYDIGGHTKLYVNRGVGTARLPMRLFCPSEIAVFELRGRAQAGGS